MTSKDTHDDVILHIIVIISIIITELISCFIQKPNASQKNSPATSPSPKRSANSSSPRQSTTTRSSTSKKTKTRTRSRAASTKTHSRANSSVTGNQKSSKTPSKDGILSLPTEKSRSGHSTQPASHRQTMKSNLTTPIVG